MADPGGEPQTQHQRFFCHRCNIEFDDIQQDYTCPFCCMGFIEHLDNSPPIEIVDDDTDDEFDDADMTNLADNGPMRGPIDLSDSPVPNTSGRPMLNDLAFLMTGDILRTDEPNRSDGSRSLLEQLVLMISGRGGGTGGGAPVVLVGAPGDYVFGGEAGLDAVVTQLLGQLEHSGPAPLPTEHIRAIPSHTITPDQAEESISCSVCWDNFVLDEVVSRLVCAHMFHTGCITPWLELHATCPVCRRWLMPDPPPESAASTAASSAASSAASTASSATSPASTAASTAPPSPGPAASATSTPSTASSTSSPPSPPASSSSAGPTQPGLRVTLPIGYSRVVVRRVGLAPRAASGPGAGPAPPPVPRGLWAALTSQLAASAAAADSTSHSSLGSDSMYMDIDFD